MKLLKYTALVMIMLSVAVVQSCGSETDNTMESIDNQDIKISSDQFATESMAIGNVELTPFNEYVECTGIISPTIKGKAIISVPIEGIISQIYVSEGKKVAAGEKLFQLSGEKIVNLQKEFSMKSANLKRLKSEYNRTKDLFDHKIGSEKDYLKAETDYKLALYDYNSEKLLIDKIGIDISKIESGEFVENYIVISPIMGTVTDLNISLGSFVEPNNKLIVLIDDENLQLKLQISPDKIDLIRINQPVEFNIGQTLFKGLISSIGNSIDEESKRVVCFADILPSVNQKIINYTIVEAKIVTTTDSVYTLPVSALLKDNNQYYCFALIKKQDSIYSFSPLSLKVGRMNEKVAEIMTPLNNQSILIEGVYNLSLP